MKSNFNVGYDKKIKHKAFTKHYKQYIPHGTMFNTSKVF